ncbi:cytochrome c [Diaphorobacter sp. HDW4A]|uniref:c-type cytochrome n=2 Tax=Bacteria TaxID=2 RepID=UPI001F10072E|nr:c-type cytochrome [Diaphorobacter sp. HDW4A]
MNSPSAAPVDPAHHTPPPPARKRRHGWRNFFLLVIVLLLLLVVAAVAGNRHTVPDRAPQTVQATPQQLKQGEYLTRMGDCIACHTAVNGQPFAGGFPLQTGFGTIYGTNITADPDHGIGRWNADEFYRAVANGTAPGGRQLYPAMPYASYHQIKREDSDLIYAYLLRQPPSARANQKPEMPFPFNLRVLMLGWKMLYHHKDELPVASQGQSVEWQRGRYLGNVLGHCAECHTPRTQLGGMDNSKWLTGSTLGLFAAPDITSAQLAERGWTPANLHDFLTRGYSTSGSAFDEMHPVIANSTQYLSADDAKAVVTFLMGDTPPAAKVLPIPAPNPAKLIAGQDHYMALCASCHGSQGLGRQLTMPPLLGNSTVRQPDGRNLVLAILVGLPKRSGAEGGPTALPGMPGFANDLDDQAIADLSNYVRGQMGALPGGQGSDITAARVAELRAAAKKANRAIAP